VTDRPVHLGFHFDVMCPWAYQTSVWIRDVRETVPIDIDWRFFPWRRSTARRARSTRGT